MKNQSVEEIICGRCKQTNFVNPNVVHAEDNSPLQLHCTYCKADIESKEVLYDKIREK